MRLTLLVSSFVLVALQAHAEQVDSVQMLTSELKSEVPTGWEVRVRWREDQLLASITPYPYQTAFELWYDQPRLHETLANLCPSADEEIWQQLKPNQDIILEPTVGGKSGVEARVSCREANLHSS